MSDWSWRSFTNYVDQNLPNFDHLPPSSGQFTYYLHFVHITNRGLSADHLPTSSCPRSYWMTPCIICASLSAPKATGSSPVAQQTCFAKAYSRKHWCKIVQTLANAKILGLLCAWVTWETVNLKLGQVTIWFVVFEFDVKFDQLDLKVLQRGGWYVWVISYYANSIVEFYGPFI